jgi:hypothetical protein
MTARLQRRLRRLRYRRRFGQLTWLVGPKATRPGIARIGQSLALRGRHLYRRNVGTEDLLACLASPA